jgi:hypothetical protein
MITGGWFRRRPDDAERISRRVGRLGPKRAWGRGQHPAAERHGPPQVCYAFGAHDLTALLVGVTKCADNISGQSSKRSQRRRSGSTQGKHRRLRNGRDGGGRRDVLAYIGIKTGSSLFGAQPFGRAPFLRTDRC